MLHFLADQFSLIVTAIYVGVSLVIIVWSQRMRLRASGATGLPGVRTAAIASVASCLLVGIVVIPLIWLLERALPSPQPDTPVIWPFLLPALILAALVSLAVLDLYALSPPRPGDRAGAAARGVIGPILVAVGILVSVQMHGALVSASSRQAQANERAAVEARSDGLSIAITVVDAQVGETTANGRIVSHLTLDVAVRSMSEIELRQTKVGLVNQAIQFDPPGSPFIDVSGGPGLPGQIPAGLDHIYRLELPVDETDPGTLPRTTGPWKARLILIGPNDAAGSPITYETSTSFTVSDAP